MKKDVFTMLHQIFSENEHGQGVDTQTQIPSEKKKQRRGATGIRGFVHWSQEEQRKAFLTWLPCELHDAPGIDWEQLPAEVMGYCVRTIGNSPDAAVLAVAAASMHGEMGLASLRAQFRNVAVLLRDFRTRGLIQHITDLREEHIWITWAKQQEKTEGARQHLVSYRAITNFHFPLYLRRLSRTDQLRMRQYALPSSPANLTRDYFPYQKLKAVQQAERKATTDILVPLYPVLRQIVRLRKQLTERLLLAFREACRNVEAGEEELPYHFQHTDVIPEVTRDARTVAEVQIQGLEVTLHLIIWDKPTWVKHHADLYSDEVKRTADHGIRAYASSQNCFFVEVENPARDVLWFGDLIEHRTFQYFAKWDGSSPEPADYQLRWQYARQLGFSRGCACGSSGLLDPGDQWFVSATGRSDALIFEPESLYRGILLGSALAMLSLSNGSRMSELLQVSMNKERRVTRTETILLLGKDGQPQIGKDGQPLTKQVKLHFQHLLPKGARTEEERQLFPLSKEAMRLLREVQTLLEETYGEVPVVAPARNNIKREDLKSERYLFQWRTWSNQQQTCISPADAQILLRFLFHGLDLYTAQGKPIRVSVHVLRHVMATHARRYRHVPPEVVAHFFLHHHLQELTGRAPTLPEVSEYYTLLTEEQRFAVISTDLDEQEELDHALLQMSPTTRDLEQKNADLQAVYEIWHSLHPTAFGNCGCPGLCPRETDRSLCLGCSYHIEDPEKLGAALVWRADYAKQAEVFEAQGNAIDARQARIKVQFLDDMINVMRMQLEEESAGRYIPVFKVLPSPHRQLEVCNENEG
ncbi:hypothetical protein ccbrp13_14680 [Ktedonobacteria bacterium brp13]|nr:hypothetical protein ccbrp13_14680 [Ktedonobacteria bacterium brp13]